MATSVYSLWLEPPPALASTSAGFIGRYAGASGGRCPTFDPHVTLAGGFVGTEGGEGEERGDRRSRRRSVPCAATRWR